MWLKTKFKWKGLRKHFKQTSNKYTVKLKTSGQLYSKIKDRDNTKHMHVQEPLPLFAALASCPLGTPAGPP